MVKAILLSALFTILTLLPNSSHASLITGLTIDAQISFDVGNSQIGGAGTHADTIGIAGNSSTVNDMVITGSNPINHSFTSDLDTLSFSQNVSSNGVGYVESYYDFNLLLSNSLLDHTIEVFFEFDFSNSINAGVEAFSDALLALYDESNTEFFFSDLTSDTLFGNEKNGAATPNFGGVESDSGVFGFSIFLNAGQSTSFTGEALVEGESFISQGMFSAVTSGVLSIAKIDKTRIGQPPVDVPAPATWLLLLSSIMLIRQFKQVK